MPERDDLEMLQPTLPGALQILSRAGGRQILILHGEERAVSEGERQAYILWFPSISIAQAVSSCCSDLLEASKMAPDIDGWHEFDVSHVKNLVAVAKSNLGVRTIGDAGPADRKPWTQERVARLGFLAGLGWTAKRIADDELVRSTPNNVYRQAHRFGISLSATPPLACSFRLPLGTSAAYDRAAARAGITREALVRRVVIAAATDMAVLVRTAFG